MDLTGGPPKFSLIFHLAREFWHDTAVLLLLEDHPLLPQELAGPNY